MCVEGNIIIGQARVGIRMIAGNSVKMMGQFHENHCAL